jgi:phosphopantothenoylcysteine synthetase/decarboxylase
MLLSVSSEAIYEMEPQIQNLDDEFVNKIVGISLEEIRDLRLSEDRMRIVITGGPSSEPIDQVRAITNRSTGELAVKLARRMADSGHGIELFLGQGAIFRSKSAKYFSTNDDLARLLGNVVEPHSVEAVFHAAALSDYGVAKLDILGGQPGAAKISSDAASIQLRLVPKPKLILQLRELFANAYLVGWKFELDGTLDDVVRKGIQQIRLNRTNACVINGAAFGPGFGICTEDGLVHTAGNRDELADWLVHMLDHNALARLRRQAN